MPIAVPLSSPKAPTLAAMAVLAGRVYRELVLLSDHSTVNDGISN